MKHSFEGDRRCGKPSGKNKLGVYAAAETCSEIKPYSKVSKRKFKK